ncbi:MAG: hypothetical protein GC160_28260 [Acidobacteria bacterium]|nr:hypothetical protein [Acidobacteriota bacterium]
MKCVTATVEIHVRGPVLSQSSSVGAPGFDALMAQAKFALNQSRYYLPGSLIKGLVREVWQEFAEVEPEYQSLISRWLGDESPKASDDRPERGRMKWSDFVDWSTEPAKRSPSRTRIQIDDERGAADEAMLQVLESPYASGQPVTFKGEVKWLAADDESEHQVVESLQKGLHWLHAVGGVRSSGFGRVMGTSVHVSKRRQQAASGLERHDRLELRLQFGEPVIFSKLRVADNWFESEEVVPGGALKGAVATMISADPDHYRELSEELSRVGFTHAFPTALGERRPSRWPMSLVSYSSDPKMPAFGDALRGSAPPVGECGKPWAFDIDWKDGIRDLVESCYGWPKLHRQVRVRTRFDSAKARADEGVDDQGGSLFAWRMIEPFSREWVCTVDLSGLSPTAREQLTQLLESFGLGPLGKSKAWANVEVTACQAPGVQASGSYCVTLQTPALLTAPGRQLAKDGTLGMTDAEVLERELRAAWSELSDGSLILVDYFQRCSLSGGSYLLARFSAKGLDYRPYLLSDAGSTFLLAGAEGRQEKAASLLAQWRRKGLPLAESVRHFYGITDDPDWQWRDCPYLPENGYGEIAVDEPFRLGGSV